MTGALTPSSISLASFKDVLSRYPSSVPEKLKDLDTLRYQSTPAALVEREARVGEVYLEKSEVLNLVEWKL